ncbi:type II secretion system F family protein [Methanospirillum hungatei]|jgi:flagellar protein FlaJ|uniref:type II secretion system F family protein n=1 Tax=Methanospirillum hungatei TaxID=2203 RepID=UPI0009C5D7A8|nr:type II secretion system F family protein [Methanospirillum hungatei]OQA59517.1 MAG: flagellar assembly protein J [Euryarchaeota archaeon ADurb.Bin294]HOW05285.1 type II secretion system F family protein [Methanospirillum hungatei]
MMLISPRQVDAWLEGTNIRRYIRAAHLPYSQYSFFMLLLKCSIASVSAFVMLTVYILSLPEDVQLIPGMANIYTILIAFVLLVPGVIIGIFTYPQTVAMGRKSSIDLDLPYAITYMQALSTTMTLYNVIRKIYEADDLFGEVGKEFGLIVRDVEVFGDDLYTAIRNLQKVTPSKNLEEFLNDLLLLSKSGGDVTNFLSSRSAYFRESAARELESILKTIEVMAEVYVTAFVAGPITMIIIIVAQNLGGKSDLAGYMPLIIIGLALGSIGMIYILYLMLPSIKMDITRKPREESEFSDVMIGKEEYSKVDKNFLKRVEAKRKRFKLENLLKNPARAYISDYNYGIALGCVCGGIVSALYYLGYLNEWIPGMSLEAFISLLIIFSLAPPSLAYEGRSWFVNSVESHTPEFLRQLVDMKDVGVTLQTAISLISNSKLGVLSQELVMTSEDIRRGATTINALVRMEDRIGLVSVKRAMSLLVKASEVTDYIKDVLIIAINDFEHYLKLKKDRFNIAITYVMIVYLAVGIYMYTAYSLNVSFVSSFTNFNISFDTSGNLTDMFRIGLVLGFFSGLMAGQLSANSVLAGLKHAILLVLGCFVLFVFIIPYQLDLAAEAARIAADAAANGGV